LNEEYLERARATVDDVRLFINGAAARAAELAHGARPLVSVLPQDDRSYLDIALLEIAEGKLVIEQGVVEDEE
jgi:DNA-directed RNA polymerase subunit K/omega